MTVPATEACSEQGCEAPAMGRIVAAWRAPRVLCLFHLNASQFHLTAMGVHHTVEPLVVLRAQPPPGAGEDPAKPKAG